MKSPALFSVLQSRAPRPPEFILASAPLLAILIAWTLRAESLENASDLRHETHPPSHAASGSLTALREGTDLVEKRGQFRMAGDRIAFFPLESAGRFIVLENLNLQRIVQMMDENPAAVEWKVSGTVTEYRGSNYLFVRSAVVEPGNAIHEEGLR